MGNTPHRHGISGRARESLSPHLPGKKGGWGGIAGDNRLFVNAATRVLRAGAPWRDLPPGYGGRGNTHRRFIRWRDRGVRGRPLSALTDGPDVEWPAGRTSRRIPVRRGLPGAARPPASRRGAERKDTSGRGCPWYAGASDCRFRPRG
jgi:transposase